MQIGRSSHIYTGYNGNKNNMATVVYLVDVLVGEQHMHSHAVEEDTIHDGGHADVADDVEPLPHGHEGEDGDAHANVSALGVIHAKGVVVERREQRYDRYDICDVRWDDMRWDDM